MVTCWQKCGSTKDRPFKLLYWSYKVVKFRYKKRSKSEISGKSATEIGASYWHKSQQEHQSDTQVITVKMEILLEPTSNKLMVDPHRFEEYLKMEVKGRSIKDKEFQRSFRHFGTERLSRSDEVLKSNNFKEVSVTLISNVFLEVTKC
ncbi:hypothetical protein Tco_0344082 [Tanacetum coccineum]